MKTKIYDFKKQAKWRILFGMIFFLIGIILQISNYYNFVLTNSKFASWLILVGIILVAIGIKHKRGNKVLKIDERYQQVVYKATGLTFMAVIYTCLTVFIVATLKPMKVDLALTVSYLLFFEIIVYRISIWYYNKRY